MTTQRSDTTFPLGPALTALLVLGAVVGGCSGSSKEADEECVDPPPEEVAAANKTVNVERFGLGRAGEENKEDKDWCRACVMSMIGYASCQRVFAETPEEERDSIRKRARAKACADAKYPEDACPDQAVINIQCKGEPPPEGTPEPGDALQNLFQKMGGGQGKLEVSPQAKPEAEAAPEAKADEASPKPATKAGDKPVVE